tara:strand:+ start:546 stop:869 length:324 start_codon:yes stop_codon:yes gene_type:complete
MNHEGDDLHVWKLMIDGVLQDERGVELRRWGAVWPRRRLYDVPPVIAFDVLPDVASPDGVEAIVFCSEQRLRPMIPCPLPPTSPCGLKACFDGYAKETQAFLHYCGN